VVYVGIDLHRRTSHVTAFDDQGLELLSRRVYRKKKTTPRERPTSTADPTG
jgi:hypothetical protein